MERTSRMDSKRNLIFAIGVAVIVVIYLVLRLSFPETIEFGYDQPRLATRIIQYIENKNIFETQRFAESSPWGNVTWGPSLFLFYSPFLILWKDPIAVSNAVAIFNSLSIIVIIYLANRYVSKIGSLTAGLLLATHPWWYVFSRMIYQPTPVLTVVSISMLLLFLVFQKPKSIWLSFLIFSWVFLTELYLHTVMFIVVSLLGIIITKKRELLNKYLLIGFVVSSLLLIPYTYHSDFDAYLPDKNKTVGIELMVVAEKIKQITFGLFKMSSGNNFKYQLGYSYGFFMSENYQFKVLEVFTLFLMLISFIYVICSIFFSKDNKFIRIMILLWFVSPILFLVPLELSNLMPLPRYFLTSLPSAILLIGILISDIRKKMNSYSVLLIPLFLSMSWIMFIIKYERYVKALDFYGGHLSPYADTQIYYVTSALDFVFNDSIKNGYEQAVISNDRSRPTEYALEWGMDYLLKYKYKINTDLKNNYSKAYYLIDYSVATVDPKFVKIKNSGPISIYKYTD